MRLSLGEAINFKITTAAELELAEAWLAHRLAAESAAAKVAAASKASRA